MRTGMASVRCMSTPSRVFGLCCGRGCVRIGGISHEKSPLYLGFFEFVHNVRRRGKALLEALIELLVRPTPRNAG
jgi:hypothetical protein